MTDIEKLYTLYGKPVCVRILRNGEFVPCEFFIYYIKLKDFFRVMRMSPADSLSLIACCTDLTDEQIGKIHPEDFIDLFTECISLNKHNLFNEELHKKNQTFKLEYMKEKQEVLADMVARGVLLTGLDYDQILKKFSFERLILIFEANIRNKSLSGPIEANPIQQTIVSTCFAKEDAKKKVLKGLERKRIEANQFGLNKS
jgi:hypothetical protein